MAAELLPSSRPWPTPALPPGRSAPKPGSFGVPLNRRTKTGAKYATERISDGRTSPCRLLRGSSRLGGDTRDSHGNCGRFTRSYSGNADFQDLYKEDFDDLPAAVSVENIVVNVEGPDGPFPVLKNCTLRIPEGKFWMLLGPNGCGKSTLLKVLAGLIRPSGGRIRVKIPRSFVFQNPDHQVVMPTVGADVAFGLGKQELPEAEVKSRVEACLKAVGMEDYMERSIQTLSGGQKQRVAIAGALAENSRVLLLDELTTFLDVNDQFSVLETLKKVVKENGNVTALWITHRLEELSFADGASYMEDGRVIMSGKTKRIQEYVKKLQAK